MTTIDVEYELSTPAFIGGADGSPAEFRLPSFKGALRFWWRATAGAGLALNDLHAREAALFGSTTGASRLTMRLVKVAGGQSCTVPLLLPASAGRSGDRPAYGAWYLGYGVFDMKQSGAVTRAYVPPPTRVELRLTLRWPRDHANRGDPRDEAQVTDEISNALIAMGLFGGLGSKARKGYGSMVLRSLIINGQERWQCPLTAEDLARQLTKLYQSCTVHEDEPEWTALSRRARHTIIEPAAGVTPFVLLDLLGREMVRFRSYGRNGQILGRETAERLFTPDHHLAKGIRTGGHPERIAFGLPHNYGRDDFNVGPAAPRLERRASLLLFHIHLCEQRPVAVVSFLPALFLPRGRDRIKLHRTRGTSKEVPLAPPDKLWAPVCRFLDRLENKHGDRIERALGTAIKVSIA